MDKRISVYEEKMTKAYEFLQSDYASIRAGRANPHILDKLRVDYYGTPTPIQQVGNITVPAALMIIGSSMARLPLKDIIGSPKVYVASFLRLAVVPISVYFLFKICGVSDIINNINTVVIAMPVASFGTMFCMKYGRNPSLMTEITFITTVASILTIPLITMLFR